jgi:O-antigen ligase
MFASPWNLFYWGAVLAPPLALVLRAALTDEPLRLPENRWLGLVALAAAALLGSALASPYRTPVLQWTALPLAGLAGLLLAHDWVQAAPANRDRLNGIAATGAGLLMLTSTGGWLLDVLGLPRAELFSATLFEMRNAHPLGHSNYTAGLALLSLPWLLHAAVRQRGLLRAFAGAGAALAVLALFTSGSRGGLLGFAALGVAALAGARLGWRRFVLLAGAALAAAALLAVANTRVRALLSPADPTAPPNISTVQREAMLTAGLRMGADRPLAGWGLASTPLVYPRYRADLAGGAENVLQLHSTPLELWAGLGAAGLLLLGGFAALAALGWSRAPAAAVALAGYGVFAFTDYQLDVPAFVAALAILAAQLTGPANAPAGRTARLTLAGVTLGILVLLGVLGRSDRAPVLNCEALALPRGPAQTARTVALLRESLTLNPDQEIAHFNLGWLLLVTEPAAAEKHFRAAAQLVPDKGGVYFGLGLARLNQGRTADAARALALECLNDPRFLASPWWKEPAVAAQRSAATAAFVALAARARRALPPGTWAARQAQLMAGLAPRLGEVSDGRELIYRRERTGYPVLMRNHDLTAPLDRFDVREDPRFVARVPFRLPPKGWLPSPVLLKLLDDVPPPDH